MEVKSLAFFNHRIAWSRAALLLAFVYALVVPAPAAISQGMLDFFELLGFGLLIVAALGRVWCLSYISGVKNEVLVTEGPYSVVRNPLYVCNFIGAVGLGLAVESPLLAALLAVGFAVFYPAVVRHEEAALGCGFGEQYRRYCNATPRWLPYWPAFHEPESWTFSPRRFRAGLLDAMWFLWVFMLWEAIEESGLLTLVRHAI